MVDATNGQNPVAKASKYLDQGFTIKDVQELLGLAEDLIALGGKPGLVNSRKAARDQLAAARRLFLDRSKKSSS